MCSTWLKFRIKTLLWICSKWLNYRIKKLHFRIKQKMITAKKEQQQHQKEKQKKKKKTWMQHPKIYKK